MKRTFADATNALSLSMHKGDKCRLLTKLISLKHGVRNQDHSRLKLHKPFCDLGHIVHHYE